MYNPALYTESKILLYLLIESGVSANPAYGINSRGIESMINGRVY